MTLREIFAEMEIIFDQNKVVRANVDSEARYILFVTYRRKMLEAFLACSKDLDPEIADIEAESTSSAVRHIAELVEVAGWRTQA